MSPCWWIEASIDFLPKYVTSLWISRRICALCTAGSPPTKPLGRLASSLLPQGNIVAPVSCMHCKTVPFSIGKDRWNDTLPCFFGPFFWGLGLWWSGCSKLTKTFATGSDLEQDTVAEGGWWWCLIRIMLWWPWGYLCWELCCDDSYGVSKKIAMMAMASVNC